MRQAKKSSYNDVDNTACTGRWGLPLRGVSNFRAFSLLWVFPAPKHCPRPPQRQPAPKCPEWVRSGVTPTGSGFLFLMRLPGRKCLSIWLQFCSHRTHLLEYLRLKLYLPVRSKPFVSSLSPSPGVFSSGEAGDGRRGFTLSQQEHLC